MDVCSLSFDIDSLLDAYRKGGLTPRALIGEIHRRNTAHADPALWIHLLTLDELAPYLDRLKDADPERFPLFGIPFAIKDNIDLAGIPTTAACPEYAYTPAASAPVVDQLIAAGALPIGKANLDQFATGLVGVRSPYGIPRHPVFPDRVPGGSSSGSAVSVSAGLVAFSLGTDTAGSGRVPALFHRLWGVKTSRGRLSPRGVVPACRSLDCVSIFALNARDCQQVLAIAEGYDPEEPFSQPTLDAAVPASPKIGIPRPEQMMFFGDTQYSAGWEKALNDLRSRGWEIQTIDFSPFMEAATLLYEGPWVAERTTALRVFLETRPDAIHPVTRAILRSGLTPSACDAFEATYRLAALHRRSLAQWEGLAAIVTPTAGGFPTLADLEADPVGPNSKLGYYTNFMNLLDLCAVATPAGETAAGLPFGITWIARRDQDRALIEIAAHGPLQQEDEGPSLNLVLFGAHMSGLPLNRQIAGLGGRLLGEVRTAPLYRMASLETPVARRPGVRQVGTAGVALLAEEWILPEAALGMLLRTIHQPLGLGEITLEDGRRVHGFLCEAIAAEKAPDISHHGGWRAYLETTG
ncbi:MAG: allophanate hydrolase [Opitutales bacterium]